MGGWMGSGICGHIWRRPSPHGTKLYPHSLSTFTIFSQLNLQSNLKVYPITSRVSDWNFCKTMHNEFFVVVNLEQKYLVSIIPFNIFIGILIIKGKLFCEKVVKLPGGVWGCGVGWGGGLKIIAI